MLFFYSSLVVLMLLIAVFIYLKYQTYQRYQRLSARQNARRADYEKHLTFNVIPQYSLPDFAQHLCVIPKPLSDDSFTRLQTAVTQLYDTERSYFPIHKQGGTIAYETLHEVMPELVALYQSKALRQLCGQVVGESLMPTPLHDQSSCSLLVYEKPGDHIGWHYDYNFYNGRHFTLLLPLVNHHRDSGELSSARLTIKQQGKEHTVDTPPNTLVLFEGAKVLHKVTALGEGETRVILSMTYCTTPQASLAKSVARRIKDVSYFGLRALWT